MSHWGWWWRKLGPIAISILTLLKFLPLIRYTYTSTVEPVYTDPNCSLHKDNFHFWTGFGASLLEYLLFSSIYWWALCHHRQKWTSGLLAIPILCSAVVLAASVSLSTWKLQSIGHILLAVRKESQD